jgi:hypothetical protein
LRKDRPVLGAELLEGIAKLDRSDTNDLVVGTKALEVMVKAVALLARAATAHKSEANRNMMN